MGVAVGRAGGANPPHSGKNALVGVLFRGAEPARRATLSALDDKDREARTPGATAGAGPMMHRLDAVAPRKAGRARRNLVVLRTMNGDLLGRPAS